MEFRVLGPLEVVHDGRAVPLAGSRERAVLAILLASPNRVVPRDLLAEDLWCGRPPEDAAGALRVFVSRLRRALRAAGGTDVVVTRPPGYLAEVDPAAVDAGRFEHLLDRARGLAAAGRAQAAVQAYDEALALWRGPALADVAGATGAAPRPPAWRSCGSRRPRSGRRRSSRAAGRSRRPRSWRS